MKQLIQVAEQAWCACAHQTCLIRIFDTRLSKRTKHRPSNTRTKEMFYVFDRMFDFLQILSNTTKYDETRTNSTKQGAQTVKCLVTKQCLMVFGRQKFYSLSKCHWRLKKMAPLNLKPTDIRLNILGRFT